LCRSCGSGAPPPHPPPHAGELLWSETYWEWFSQKCDLPTRRCTAPFVHMHKIFSTMYNQ
jgi:hypothetical protein